MTTTTTYCRNCGLLGPEEAQLHEYLRRKARDCMYEPVDLIDAYNAAVAFVESKVYECAHASYFGRGSDGCELCVLKERLGLSNDD